MTVQLQSLDGIVDPRHDIEPMVEATARLRPAAGVGEVEVDVPDVARDRTDVPQIAVENEVLSMYRIRSISHKSVNTE